MSIEMIPVYIRRLICHFFPSLIHIIHNMAAEPVPQEARRLVKLLNEKNPALQIPDDYIDTHIHFEGGDLPVQPGCLKSGALCAAAFAAFGAVANQVAQDRYG